MKKSIYYFIPFIIFPFVGFTQDATADLKKINTFYLSKKGICCDVNYKIFDTWQSETASEEKDGEIRKWMNYKYFRIGKLETITTPDSYLAVDHDKKRIFLASMKFSSVNESIEILSNIGSLLKLCKKIDYKEELSDNASYTFQYPSGNFEKIKIIFNRHKYYIVKMVIYSKLVDNEKVYKGRLNKPKVEIAFNNVLSDKKYSESDFSFNKYIEKRNEKWICVKKYSTYDFVNQLNRQ